MKFALGMITLAALIGLVGPAGAKDRPSDKRGSFSCVATGDFEEMSADGDFIRMNNFTISEVLGSRRDAAGIKVAYAITNGASFEVFTSSDFILLDVAGEPLAAVTAGPPKLTVGAVGSAIATGATMVEPGTLAATGSICFRSMVSSK